MEQTHCYLLLPFKEKFIKSQPTNVCCCFQYFLARFTVCTPFCRISYLECSSQTNTFLCQSVHCSLSCFHFRLLHFHRGTYALPVNEYFVGNSSNHCPEDNLRVLPGISLTVPLEGVSCFIPKHERMPTYN